jgi:TetR/AcrR family transcriptional repressor of nem operon
MARPKEFDETVVLGKALDLFRARGFKHTSFEDLTEELGICRQSLYDTFGDKQALYQASLSRYLERGLERVSAVLGKKEPARQGFARLFDEIIDGHCAHGSPGCFMVNSMVELAPHDAETRALAMKHAREMERIFATRISMAQRQGEIGDDKDPVAIARFLYHTILGLSVAARALGERESLRETARIALKELG